MIRATEDLGVSLIPTVAMLDAGPLVTKEALDYALGVLLDIVKENWRKADGICLALHGAGCAEGIDDMKPIPLSASGKLWVMTCP